MINIDKVVELALKKYNKGIIFLCERNGNQTSTKIRIYPINICRGVIKKIIEDIHHETIENIIVYDKHSFSEVDNIDDFIYSDYDSPQLRAFTKISSKYLLSDYVEIKGVNDFCIKIHFNYLDDRLKCNLINFLNEINQKNLFIKKFNIIMWCNHIIVGLK